MFIFLTVLGGLLLGFGGLAMIAAIPYTSWDASWAEIKEAFYVMFHKRRFQVGSIFLLWDFDDDWAYAPIYLTFARVPFWGGFLRLLLA